ncbi:TonB-dependent receptor [Sphingosinicellaceae bacterium]|nr:TonB-dependent receptor [Sphingosinicellaceae bacterium]
MRSLLTLTLLATAAPVLAQSNPSLPTTDASGETIVVTASRSGDAVRVDQLGASVTVLDAAALDERQTRQVSDILRDVPGVAVNRSGGVGGLTQVRLRGTEGNHVLVLIDGIKASDPYSGEFDFGTLIADEAAKIEVLRGQQSSLYGSDAIGGVIQYITLTGAEQPGISARLEGGSFGTVSGGARVAGVSGPLDYVLTSSTYHTDGTPTAVGGSRDLGSDQVGASGKLTWTPSEIFKLTGVARYSWTDADLNNTENDPSSPRFGTIIDSPGTYYTARSLYGLVRGELSLLDGRWTNVLSGQVADTKRSNYTAAGLDFGDHGTRYKGSFESAIRFDSDRVKQRVTGAVDVEREEFRNSSPENPFTFTGKRHTDNVGLVGVYDLVVDDRLAVGASVRHDFNTRFADATTFRVQGSYKLDTGTRFRAAYGTGVKNPGYFELYGFSDGRYIGNPNLKPEKSKGWEAGVEQSLIDGKATLGVTYFRSKLTDEIFTTYPAPDYIATPGNRDTLSKQHGVEVFASARPIQQLRIDLSYTHLHAREDGAVEVRRPNDIGSANFTVFSKDERFSGTLTARYNGDQRDVAFTDPSFVPVNVVLKDYVLLNLAASYKLTKTIEVFGRVENLLDEKYQEVFSFVSPGRGAYGGVRLSF